MITEQLKIIEKILNEKGVKFRFIKVGENGNIIVDENGVIYKWH